MPDPATIATVAQTVAPPHGWDWGQVVGAVGGVSTVLAFIGSKIWKAWSEHRLNDTGVEVTTAAAAAAGLATAAAGAASVSAQTQIQQQQSRISTLETRLDGLETRLDQETLARQRAQGMVISLRFYIQQLQALMRSAGLSVPDMPNLDPNNPPAGQTL